jgi:hypothetical protein
VGTGTDIIVEIVTCPVLRIHRAAPVAARGTRGAGALPGFGRAVARLTTGFAVAVGLIRRFAGRVAISRI